VKMYLVAFVDCDGENKDLFVQARSPEEARMLWVQYYDLTPEEDEKFDGTGYIFEVPLVTGSEPRAILWDRVSRQGTSV